MSKPSMTFAQGLKISWQRELEIGDPWRILRLAFFTVHYSWIHVLCYVIPNALIALGKRLKD